MIFSIELQAQSDDYFQMRISWIKTMKDVLIEIEKSHPEDHLTQRETKFLEKFSFIEEAWADSPYNCFFAGWPSTIKIIKGKKYCTSPKTSNQEYQNGSCTKNELQCQPYLFGEALCVSFQTKTDKQTAMSRCEDKFQKEKNGNYDYLKELNQDEINDLLELTYLAGDVCERGRQKESNMCRILLKKIPDAIKSIQKAWPESFKKKASNRTVRPIKPSKDVVCTDVTLKNEEVDSLLKVSDAHIDQLYEEMRVKFEASPLCRPENVVNDPNEKPSGVLVQKLMSGFDLIESKINKEDKMKFLQKLGQDFHLSQEALSRAQHVLEYPSSNYHRDQFKFQIILLKDFFKVSKGKPDFMSDEIKNQLARAHIFARDSEDKIVCPFVTKDAFKKAIEGRVRVMGKKPFLLTNDSTLTIVDYSRPSNQRRLYVLDLNSKEVIHNTWVGQGHGGKSGAGVDGLGSSPKMSNEDGSKMSSEGFMVAGKKDRGAKYGPNISLEGIDKNNTNLKVREIVLHGWYTPYEGYSTGVETYNYKDGLLSDVRDVMKEATSLDPEMASTQDMMRALYRVRSSADMAPYMMPTAGCLGVSVAKAKHLDRKGRNKNQLELLREDLPGSLIFSYSGSDMQSNYFQ